MQNSVTPERFKELRTRFSGSLSVEDAMTTLSAAGRDQDMPPVLRMHTAMAILDLKTGRSVQSTMARFRRAVGLDPEKRAKP